MISIRVLRLTAGVAFGLCACFAAPEAGAVFTCTIDSVTSITTYYDPTFATNNDSTGSYTFTCTRAANNPSTMNYTLQANNGLHASGSQNRVQLNGSNLYNYGLYQDAGFTQAWSNTAATQISASLSFGTSLSASFTGPFYLRVPGNQTQGSAGTYTDTVTVTLNPQGGGNTVTASMGVNVITPANCQISVPPGNVNFVYTSLQTSAAAASSLFGVLCTPNTPYAMALDATSGTLLGLNYTLSLSATSATGSGFTQTYTINGGISSGQAGTCSTGVCTGSQTRTLTISY